MSHRALLLGILSIVTVACRTGRDPDALLGAWENGRDRVEFLPAGRVRFVSTAGERTGTYRQVGPDEIRVDLESRWPSGEPRYWRALARGDQLGLCETHNGRHCMRFARSGHTVRILPR